MLRSGQRLAIDHCHSGEITAIYLHGTAEGRYVWDNIIPNLVPEIGALTFDLRGHGSSQWSSEGRYSLNDYVTDLEEMLESAQLQKYILVGHSLGGAIALALASRQPAGLRGLVLVDLGSKAIGETEGVALIKHHPKRVYKSSYNYFDELVSRRPLGRPDILAQYASASLKPDGHGSWIPKTDPAIYQAASAQGVAPLLSTVSAPTLIVRGAFSSVLTKEEAANYAQHACVVGQVEIERSGHAIMSENPEQLVDALNRFYADPRIRRPRERAHSN